MKLQLDFDDKVITIENDVNLKEFVDKIKVLIPNWGHWTLKTQTTINWYYKPYVPCTPYIPYNPYPIWSISGGSTDSGRIMELSTTDGVSEWINNQTTGIAQMEV